MIRNSRKKFKFILHIPIQNNDAISAIDLYDDMILIGTLMGYVKLCYINKFYNVSQTNNTNSSREHINPQITNVMELASENISCLSFDSKDSLNFAVGDFEIYHISISQEENNSHIMKNKNYPNENEHIKYCEVCMCYMAGNKFFKINTQLAEGNEPIEMKKFTYEAKTIKTFEVVDGEIEMSNYAVPFDFDGDKFIWVDYLTQTKRRLCTYYTNLKRLHLAIPLSDDFGHISHMKLLPANRVFIVKNYNQCEIRLLKSSFEITDKFNHIGNEVIATAIYLEGSKISEFFKEEFLNAGNNKNYNSAENKKDLYLKINHHVENTNKKKNRIFGANVSLNFQKENESSNLSQTLRSNIQNNMSLKCMNSILKTNENVSIATLDFDGNFNLYCDQKESNLFNIYNIEGITNEFKEKEFFSIGFPYYITFNQLYYVISTDHGAFVFERE